MAAKKIRNMVYFAFAFCQVKMWGHTLKRELFEECSSAELSKATVMLMQWHFQIQCCKNGKSLPLKMWPSKALPGTFMTLSPLPHIQEGTGCTKHPAVWARRYACWSALQKYPICFEAFKFFSFWGKNALWKQGKRLKHNRFPQGSTVPLFNCRMSITTAVQSKWELVTPRIWFGLPLYHWPQKRMEIIWWLLPHYSILVWMWRTQFGHFLKKYQKWKMTVQNNSRFLWFRVAISR